MGRTFGANSSFFLRFNWVQKSQGRAMSNDALKHDAWVWVRVRVYERERGEESWNFPRDSVLSLQRSFGRCGVEFQSHFPHAKFGLSVLYVNRCLFPCIFLRGNTTFPGNTRLCFFLFWLLGGMSDEYSEHPYVEQNIRAVRSSFFNVRIRKGISCVYPKTVIFIHNIWSQWINFCFPTAHKDADLVFLRKLIAIMSIQVDISAEKEEKMSCETAWRPDRRRHKARESSQNSWKRKHSQERRNTSKR